MTIGALVVDDEPLARTAIVRLLGDDPDIELLGECGDGRSAVDAIRAMSPGLVFLDIQMPAMNGMDVVETIGSERMPATVFVTAYEDYAVRAFDANAVDYLVKPFSRNRFAGMLQRVKHRLRDTKDTPTDTTALTQVLEMLRRRDGYLTRIPLRKGEQLTFLDVAEIVWIKANGNTVEVHTAREAHPLRDTMATLAERLDPRHFARVHRSAIVNIGRVQAIHPWFNGYHVVTMDTGQKLRMSRYQHEAFVRLVAARA